jgi:hypothetical protein
MVSYMFTHVRNAAKRITAPVDKVADESEPVRTAIAGGIAVISATLAVLGIQPDLLTSLLRNFPFWMVLAFMLVLLGLTIPLIAFPEKAERVKRWGLRMLVAGVILLVITSICGFGIHEQPNLTITPSWSSSVAGQATVTVETSAVSQSAKDELLLRIIGLPESGVDDAHDACQAIEWNALKDTNSTMLFRGSSGPGKSGTASVKTSLPVSSTDFEYICAYASTRPSDAAGAKRGATALLDLKWKTIGASPEPTTTPTSTSVEVRVSTPDPQTTTTTTTTTTEP